MQCLYNKYYKTYMYAHKQMFNLYAYTHCLYYDEINVKYSVNDVIPIETMEQYIAKT